MRPWLWPAAIVYVAVQATTRRRADNSSRPSTPTSGSATRRHAATTGADASARKRTDGEGPADAALHRTGRSGGRSLCPARRVGVYRDRMIRVGVVGLGKMGLSHHALDATPIPRSRWSACDASKLRARRAGEVHRRRDLRRLRDDAGRGRARRGRDRHPVQRSRADGAGGPRARPARLLREAADARAPTSPTSSPALARERGLVTQVGYHNRFVGAFREVKRAARRRRDRRGHATSSARPTGRWC